MIPSAILIFSFPHWRVLLTFIIFQVDFFPHNFPGSFIVLYCLLILWFLCPAFNMCYIIILYFCVWLIHELKEGSLILCWFSLMVAVLLVFFTMFDSELVDWSLGASWGPKTWMLLSREDSSLLLLRARGTGPDQLENFYFPSPAPFPGLSLDWSQQCWPRQPHWGQLCPSLQVCLPMFPLWDHLAPHPQLSKSPAVQ